MEPTSPDQIPEQRVTLLVFNISMVMHLLIASFFVLVGAEIRRELGRPQELIAPFFAALGGMVLPALIFRVLEPESDAWGATMPTDIVLVLAVIALLGHRVDAKLRLFVLALAVSDDLLSLLVIAFFYGGAVDTPTALSTFAATFLGFFAPRRNFVIRYLKPWAFFVVTPIVILTHLPHELVLSLTVWNYVVARMLGKAIGIALIAWLFLRRELFGIGLLCGMGMTVSLIITEISTTGVESASIQTAVYVATVLSGILGYIWIRLRNSMSS